MTSRPHRVVDVPVQGGVLRVGVWDATSDAPTVLLIHGVTASHLSWSLVADRLPGVRVLAPDLRGRGRSSETVGELGMTAHARDLVAVLDAWGVDRALVVGHSMGAFVALVLASHAPSRVARLVLVDGGLPLALPEGLSPQEVVRTVLGPTAERLSMRFASVEAYLDFWRAHPAFAKDWSPALEAYLAYDLVGEAPALRPATLPSTVERDSLDQNAGAAIAAARAGLGQPAVLLSAERGLLDQVPPLYPPVHLADELARLPQIRHTPVRGVNHYTIVLSERGADAVAAAIRAEIAAG